MAYWANMSVEKKLQLKEVVLIGSEDNDNACNSVIMWSMSFWKYDMIRYDIRYMMYDVIDMIWYNKIGYDMIYDMIDTIRYDTIRYDMIWCDVIRYDDMIWYDTIWYDMVWYDMIRYDIIWNLFTAIVFPPSDSGQQTCIKVVKGETTHKTIQWRGLSS